MTKIHTRRGRRPAKTQSLPLEGPLPEREGVGGGWRMAPTQPAHIRNRLLKPGPTEEGLDAGGIGLEPFPRSIRLAASPFPLSPTSPSAVSASLFPIPFEPIPPSASLGPSLRALRVPPSLPLRALRVRLPLNRYGYSCRVGRNSTSPKCTCAGCPAINAIVRATSAGSSAGPSFSSTPLNHPGSYPATP